jgi:ATP diphosphatase
MRPRATRERRAARAIRQLVRLMDILRSRDGCPWDREQTPQSLRPFQLEETYAAIDAIDRGDTADLAGELGDVMFQCVFQAQIAAEAGHFDLADALDRIAAKLVRRHPHVFTKAGRPLSKRQKRGHVRDAPAVLEQWEQIKAREQADAGVAARLLAGVPRALPALARAHEIGTRVAAVGFDWNHPADVVAKIEEETRELAAATGESPARVAEELGDVLFTIAHLSRKLGIDAESALREANDKFTRRFAALEDHLRSAGRTIHDATPDEMERAAHRSYERDLPVGLDNHRAVIVGPEDRRAGRGKPRYDLRRRMTEEIVPSGTDDGNLRTKARQQVGTRGRPAAVMSDLQDTNAGRVCLRRQPPLELGAGVAGEPQLDLAVADTKHDGVVVAHALPLPLGWRRMHRLDGDRSQLQPRPGEEGSPGDAAGIREAAKPGALHVRRDRHTLPHFSGSQIAHDGRRAASVVAIAMGNGEPVQTAHAERPSGRSDDPTADVERAGATSRIDKQ